MRQVDGRLLIDKESSAPHIEVDGTGESLRVFKKSFSEPRP